MKKIFFALAMLPLLVIGCSSDDDDFTNPPDIDFDYNIETLYGEWRATEVEIANVMKVDLTEPETELIIAPTYITFTSGGVYESEGILGEGTGEYLTEGKTITTKLDNNEVTFKVIALSSKVAKIEIDAKAFDLELIPEGIETVVVELTKEYPREIIFDFDIEKLYGEWQATAVELEGVEIDVTEVIDPTFVTFEAEGVYSSRGILGKGKGKYAVKGDDVAVMVDGGDVISFDMKELNDDTAKIEIDASKLNIDIIPEGTEEVTVVLTKQTAE